MIKKPQTGERVALPGGTVGTVKQVHRERPDARCGRVSVLTLPDNQWHMAFDLQRVDRVNK